MKIIVLLASLLLTVTSCLPYPYVFIIERILEDIPVLSPEQEAVLKYIHIWYHSYTNALRNENVQQAKLLKISILTAVESVTKSALSQRYTDDVVKDVFELMLDADAEEAEPAPSAFLNRTQHHILHTPISEFESILSALRIEKAAIATYYHPKMRAPLLSCRLAKSRSLSALVEYLSLHVYNDDIIKTSQLLNLLSEINAVMNMKSDKYVDSILQSGLPIMHPLPIYHNKRSRAPSPHTISNWTASQVHALVSGAKSKEDIIVEADIEPRGSIGVKYSQHTCALKDYFARVNKLQSITGSRKCSQAWTHDDQIIVLCTQNHLYYSTRQSMMEYFIEQHRQEAMQNELLCKKTVEMKDKVRQVKMSLKGGHVYHLKHIRAYCQSRRIHLLSIGGRLAMSQSLSSVYHHEQVEKRLHKYDILFQYSQEGTTTSDEGNTLRFSEKLLELSVIKSKHGITHPAFMIVLRGLANDWLTAVMFNTMDGTQLKTLGASLRALIGA